MTQLKGEISPCGTNVIECNPYGDCPLEHEEMENYPAALQQWQQAAQNRQQYTIDYWTETNGGMTAEWVPKHKPGTLVEFEELDNGKCKIIKVVC